MKNNVSIVTRINTFKFKINEIVKSIGFTAHRVDVNDVDTSSIVIVPNSDLVDISNWKPTETLKNKIDTIFAQNSKDMPITMEWSENKIIVKGDAEAYQKIREAQIESIKS